MLSTITAIALLLGLLSLAVILWALFLRLGLRWAKVQGVTTRRLALATASVIAIQIGLNILFRLLSPTSNAQAILLAVLELAAAVFLPCLVIARVFQAGFLRSLQAWLPTLLPAVGMLLFSLLVLRPFLYEAFISPTNAMAPTLLGTHWQGVCPQCGKPNYCTPDNPHFAGSDPRQMICQNFHVTPTSGKDFRVFSGDHFLVAKFLAPRRWDLVVFQFPGNPAQLYVMRLVGLPGETIHIEDGAVWANGEKLSPPDSLRGNEYLSDFPGGFSDLWGTKDRPAVLSDGEYFMLGDFSAQSSDSRFWGDLAAPGEHSYAVPQSHMKGVVTHIHWPPHRWRIFR
jgi:signal peptidase I